MLGRRGAAVLRPDRQAGQLPGGSEPLGGNPSGQPAGRLSAVSAEGLGRRCRAAGQGRVPDTIRFQTKPDIALEQIRAMRAAGVPAAAVLFDPAYGNDGKFRAGITAEGLPYVAGVFATLLVWRPGEAPPSRRVNGARGASRARRVHSRSRSRRWPWNCPPTPGRPSPGGRAATCCSPPALPACGCAPAPQAAGRSELAAEQWLLIEWPVGEAAPDHYWLSTLPADIGFERMVDLAKLRWRIERDYLELKQEVGLGHFEGRRWRGFHHHASLCIAAYGFLVSERETFPPQAVPEPNAAGDLAFPLITDPEVLPLRTQRHMPNSIATLRLRLARTLVRALPRCPCCGQMHQRPEVPP